MAFQMPEIGILALAMMVTLLSGGIDLSIIAIANLAALTMAFVMNRVLPTEGAAGVWAASRPLAGFVGVAVGLVNGAFIAYLRVSPILATLGTMSLVKGLAIGLTRGNVFSGFPPAWSSSATARSSAPRAHLRAAGRGAGRYLVLGRTPFGCAYR